MDELLLYLSANQGLANALATVASALIALAAFFVSAVSVYFSRSALKIQRRHNILTIKPIPLVSVGDYENRLTVKILNNGSGPLIIKEIHIEGGVEIQESLVACMPPLPNGICWNTFVGPVKDRSLLPGKEMTLLELIGDDDAVLFKKARDNCRVALSQLVVVFDYTDVYDSIFVPYQKELSWFGRTLLSD